MPGKLKPLVIGGLKIPVPIIQGGMGVRVSTAPLASAVTNCGCAGTISSIGLGSEINKANIDYVKESSEALKKEIISAKEKSTGAIGVNVMVALTNYEQLVRTAAATGADFIASGAGLPLKLPGFVKDTHTKLIPIVSSVRATDLIIKTWKKRYNRFPDAIIVEGPLAGGHLGFKFEHLASVKEGFLELLVIDIVKLVNSYEKEFKVTIPVIAAGGIYDGKDIVKFINAGASGVQIGTRFVATFECSISDKFKKLYISAQEKDIVIIKSPVGLPGRVIQTKFTKEVMGGKRIPIQCMYKCLITCDPTTAPYCIAKALLNAVEGNIDDSVVFTGQNVSRIDKIVSVKELIDTLVAEAEEALKC